jgi:hypothetical protein
MALLVLFGFVATFLVAGNLAILGATAWAKETFPGTDVETPAGIRKFEVVDDHVWRGAAPGREGYASLAERGV